MIRAKCKIRLFLNSYRDSSGSANFLRGKQGEGHAENEEIYKYQCLSISNEDR